MSKRHERVALPVVLWVVMATAAHAQVFTTLANFDGTNGAAPISMSLVQGVDGNFYGTTDGGGSSACERDSNGCGVIFRITSTGLLATLYMFCGVPACENDANPQGGVTLGADGDFYGTTTIGGTGCSGAYGCGTIFKISAAGALTTLYNFCSAGNECSDGGLPFGALVLASDDDFYGTTFSGGAHGVGTVFKITPNGAFTTVYNFCSLPSCGDGSGPLTGLIQATDGNFYGTTGGGGAHGQGTVFKMTPQGTLTTLYSFCTQPNCTDGYFPMGTLAQGADKNFYGTTNLGGDNQCLGNGGFLGCGTVFKITAEGALTTLHAFEGPDGTDPRAGLISATDGNLYGTTFGNGVQTEGTVFAITTAGTLTTLHVFQGSDGAAPWGGLLQSTNGILYGTTYGGGTGGCCDGTVFSLNMGLAPFVTFVRAAGRVGQTAEILGQGFAGVSTVLFNGTPARFTVRRDSFLTATVPTGATTGYVTVTTPSGVLKSNVPFHVIP